MKKKPKKLTKKQIESIELLLETKRKRLKKLRYGQVEESLFLMEQIEHLRNLLINN